MRMKMMSRSRSFPFRRRKRGALAAEYVATLYVLFLFIFFPVLNLATCGMRSFFLWFATNQAVMLAVKSKTFNTQIEIPPSSGNFFPGAYATARARANQIKSMFPGVGWTQTAVNPEVRIILSPIPGSGATSTIEVVGPAALGVGNSPDVTQYVPSVRVTIDGWVNPLVPVPFFGNIPGLTGPMFLRMCAQAEFENPPGLQI